MKSRLIYLISPVAPIKLKACFFLRLRLECVILSIVYLFEAHIFVLELVNLSRTMMINDINYSLYQSTINFQIIGFE